MKKYFFIHRDILIFETLENVIKDFLLHLELYKYFSFKKYPWNTYNWFFQTTITNNNKAISQKTKILIPPKTTTKLIPQNLTNNQIFNILVSRFVQTAVQTGIDHGDPTQTSYGYIMTCGIPLRPPGALTDYEAMKQKNELLLNLATQGRVLYLSSPFKLLKRDVKPTSLQNGTNPFEHSPKINLI